MRTAQWSLRASFLCSVLAISGCGETPAPFDPPHFEEVDCEDYASVEHESAIFYNNVWNSRAAGDFDWRQCVVEDGNAEDPTYGWYWRWPASSRDIFAQPQVKVGSSPWDPLPKVDARFPLLLGGAQKLEIAHQLRVKSSGNHNIATTMWLVDDPDFGDEPNRSVIRAEIMFWTYATKGQMDPAGEKIGMIEDGGQRWSIWLDRNWGDASGVNDNRWIYLAIKSETPSFSMRFDAAKLLSDPLLKDLGLQRFYVADVEVGTEIMDGEGVAWVDSFEVIIEP